MFRRIMQIYIYIFYIYSLSFFPGHQSAKNSPVIDAPGERNYPINTESVTFSCLHKVNILF